jgi:IclR-like helix-turn-helix domain-containing protein
MESGSEEPIVRESLPSTEDAENERLVSITLSRSQVSHVMSAVLGGRLEPGLSPSGIGPNLHDGHIRQALNDHYRSLQGNRRLSRSLLAGLLVLSCFSPNGPELGIKEISEQLELNSSTVHRYVATLLAAGLLERDPDTRRYRLLSG